MRFLSFRRGVEELSVTLICLVAVTPELINVSGQEVFYMLVQRSLSCVKHS